MTLERESRRERENGRERAGERESRGEREWERESRGEREQGGESRGERERMGEREQGRERESRGERENGREAEYSRHEKVKEQEVEDMRQTRREDMRWNQESYYNNPLTTLDLQETVIEFLESARVGNGKSCFKTIINRNLPKKSQWGHLCSDPLLMTCWCRHWSFVRVRV